MGRYYYDKKEEADGLKKITIFRLKEWKYLKWSMNGTIYWTSNWDDSKSSVSIQTIIHDDEKYLRIWYTQTDRYTEEKQDFDYKIPLVTTKCNLGGKRYWFICPWYRNDVYCGRRVAVLYKGGKYFACRHCYDLSYSSRNENRNFRLFAFGQMLSLERKIEELEPKIKTKLYNGRPTRKYKRLMELNRRCYGMDMDAMLENMEKMLKS